MDSSVLTFPRDADNRNADVVFDGQGKTYDGSNSSEACKVSHCFNYHLGNFTLLGGSEDCIDLTRGANITLKSIGFVRQLADQEITAKGGIKKLHVIDCHFSRTVLGQYSIYDQLTRNKLFAFSRPPLREPIFEDCSGDVVLWHSERPILIGSSQRNIHVRRVPFLLTYFYFWFCGRFGDRRVLTPDQFTLDPREI